MHAHHPIEFFGSRFFGGMAGSLATILWLAMTTQGICQDSEAAARLLDVSQQSPDSEPLKRDKFEAMIQALESRQEALAKHSEEMAKRRIELEQQLADVQAELAQLQHQPQVLDAEQAMLYQQLAAVRDQLLKVQNAKREAKALSASADAVTSIFKLRHGRAQELAMSINDVLENEGLRVAVDDSTNALVVSANKNQMKVVRSLVEQLDQPRSANDDRAAGETLQLRVVWLLDGLPEGQGKAPTAGLVSPEVVDALKELGFENPKVLSQQNTTITVQQESTGEFEFSVPAVIQNWGWRFVGHGNVHRTGPHHFNVAFNLAIEKFSGVGNKMVQEVKLSGATNMPLRHYTVIGMTTVVALRPEEDELQQHLSAFVVYLDRAREFPAEGAESADGR